MHMDSNSIDAGSRFLASTLHEIRTPIQTIISTAEFLRDTKLDKEQIEYLHQIEFSANTLLQLANDVLDYTKIKSNEFKLEKIPFDVGKLIEDVTDLVSIEAFNKGIEVITNISTSVPQMVMGDPTRIEQILLNLIKNAAKFTREGYILVKLSVKDNDLLFEVIDTGIGISADKQSLVFNDFYQVDASTTRQYGGTGLGLSICKNLVTAQNGTIGVRNNSPKGSVFYFTIPLEVSEIDVNEKTKEQIYPEDASILIVDDNKFFIESLIEKLSDFGINNVQTALTGEEAVEKITSAINLGKKFSITFIDMIMPKMDGWRLADHITNELHIHDMKLYMMIPEGQTGKDAKMKFLNWYDGYIYKPIKNHSLKELLNSALGVNQITELEPVEEPKINLMELKEPAKDDSVLAKNMKILVAEDHPVNRKLLDSMLKKFGAKVFTAENGEEAVNAIKHNPEIDMILMDILMPVKSGLDATVELRNFDYKGIIIACTANNDPEDFNEYLRLGINDIIIKPFKRDAVKQILEKWNTVLSFPVAKESLNMVVVKDQAENLWDVSDFMDTVKNDFNLAKVLMQDYIDSTGDILERIKNELGKEIKNYTELENLAHALKGSSASVSASKLIEYADEMNTAATNHDDTLIESARTFFELDFVTFKKIVDAWKTNLQEY